MKITVEAENLAHPEGPAPLGDGSIVFVETFREQVSIWRRGRPVAQFALCGGGPNACCTGTDGVYVTQIGGRVGSWTPTRQRPPSIQKIRPNGDVVTLLTSVDRRKLTAPNDLCFGVRGNLCFTDPGDFNPNDPDDGFIFSVDAEGRCDFVLEVGPVFPNGIIALPDDSIVWVESYTRCVRRRDADGDVAEIARLPEGHMPDGFKAASDGSLYIASIMSGGIDVVDMRSGKLDFIKTGGRPLNCLFVGNSLYVTDDGVLAHDDPAIGTANAGRLFRLDLDIDGMPPFAGSVETYSDT